MIFAELIMAVFGVPVNFTASLQHGWKLGKPFCDVHGFALTLESKYLSVPFIIKNTATVKNALSDIDTKILKWTVITYLYIFYDRPILNMWF